MTKTEREIFAATYALRLRQRLDDAPSWLESSPEPNEWREWKRKQALLAVEEASEAINLLRAIDRDQFNAGGDCETRWLTAIGATEGESPEPKPPVPQSTIAESMARQDTERALELERSKVQAWHHWAVHVLDDPFSRDDNNTLRQRLTEAAGTPHRARALDALLSGCNCKVGSDGETRPQPALDVWRKTGYRERADFVDFLRSAAMPGPAAAEILALIDSVAEKLPKPGYMGPIKGDDDPADFQRLADEALDAATDRATKAEAEVERLRARILEWRYWARNALDDPFAGEEDDLLRDRLERQTLDLLDQHKAKALRILLRGCECSERVWKFSERLRPALDVWRDSPVAHRQAAIDKLRGNNAGRAAEALLIWIDQAIKHDDSTASTDEELRLAINRATKATKTDKPVNIDDAVEFWIADEGFDGLVNDPGGCCCFAGNLMPCDNPSPYCEAGHAVEDEDDGETIVAGRRPEGG